MAHLSTLRNINGNNAISVIVMVHAYFNYILLTVLLDLNGNNINKLILFKLPLPVSQKYYPISDNRNLLYLL